MKTLRRLFVIALIGAFVLAGFVWQELETLSAQSLQIETGEQSVEIASGTTPRQVLRSFQQQGWIRSSPFYRVYFYRFPEQSAIKAGLYRVTPGQTLGELLRHIVKGDVQQFSFTIVEGWNIRELRQALNSVARLQKKTSALSDAELMRELGSEGVHPEGQFFPDTYLFTAQESDLELLRRAHQRLQQQLAEAWAERAPDLPYRDPYQALIMASIVEKETGLESERFDIAGVFVRRLEKGMRLQTDPTVIYGLGLAYHGNIRKKDLQTDTPYNTYTRGGLPPTPIAMAGREALDAALHPSQSDALFFVASGSGGHVFSATLEAHNQAVAHYLNSLKRRKH